jgi:uncharacterized OsmC-like protein
MATIKTVKAEAKLLEQFKIEGKIRDHLFYADQPAQAGGTNAGPAPLEYMLFSLAACVVTVGQIMAKQQRINLRGITVKVEGEVDADVFMGKGEENRAGFLGVRIITNIDADMSLDEKKKFLEAVDRRCPVSDNIKEVTPVFYEVVE